MFSKGGKTRNNGRGADVVHGEGTGSIWLKHRGRIGADDRSTHKVNWEREANLLACYQLC